MKPIFPGTVNKGKLTLHNPETFKTYFQKFEGKEVELTIQKKRKRITTPELRYYYGVILPYLCNYFGYTPEEMDLILKYKFLKRVDKNGLERIPSKTELSTIETEAFYEEIRQWALIDYNIYIPLPNEVEY